ncbi:MAG TPA: PTS sugar transporter subunit IIA [Elusimicrobiota bacterium]|nr:PTS sugar transporter subunit IIA [Elusimicrobiota bacterium]
MKSLLKATEEGRLVELPDVDKEKCLRYLAHLIEAIPDFAGTPELAEAMLAREQVQNTCLGSGVACPHVRVTTGSELVCAVGWSPAGIDYGEGKKVHLVVMYFIPDAQKGAYLKEVSSLAKAIYKEGSIKAIEEASDIGVVREKLLDWVSAALEAAAPEAKARMIRLEARQAAIEAMPEQPQAGAWEVLSLSIISDGERVIALCPSAALSVALEKDSTLREALKPGGQFDRGGYRVVCRSSTPFPGGRTLYDCLAVRLPSSS